MNRGPVNSRFLNQIWVVGPHGRLHHLTEEVLRQVGEGRPELRGSVGLQLGLSFQQLGDVDVGEAGLLRYLTERLAGLVLRRL